MRERGTYKSERVITSPMEPTMHVLSGRQSQPSEVINFCANNYLGLSNHPRLIEAAKATLDSHGVGMSSVRFICGTQDIHKRLEAAIADFHGTEEAIVYPSCFDANAGVFESLLGLEDAIVSDALNHASRRDPSLQGPASTLQSRRHGRPRGKAPSDARSSTQAKVSHRIFPHMSHPILLIYHRICVAG